MSDFCVRIKSGPDHNLCSIDNHKAKDWAGSELKVIFQKTYSTEWFFSFNFYFFLKILHNNSEIKKLPTGFTDEHICIDGFDIINDLFEIRASDSDAVSWIPKMYITKHIGGFKYI